GGLSRGEVRGFRGGACPWLRHDWTASSSSGTNPLRSMYWATASSGNRQWPVGPGGTLVAPGNSPWLISFSKVSREMCSSSRIWRAVFNVGPLFFVAGQDLMTGNSRHFAATRQAVVGSFRHV